MPFLPSIPDDAKVPHVLGIFTDSLTGRPLLEFHQKLLRGDSPFSVSEREFMAAFISGVNACEYCHGAHTAVSKLFGVPEEAITGAIDDIDTAPVDDKMRPVLKYLRKLTLTPSRMVQADADAVYEAGWDERALYDAVQVCCLYNFMNRFIFGLGLTPIAEDFEMEGKMIKEGGYNGMLDAFGIK
jgi:uncharacterized peroxidase-related enzyme